MRVSLSKICILSVFAQTFNLSQSVLYLSIFVFSYVYVQEFGNERSVLEGLLKQVKEQRGQERTTFRCHLDVIFKFKMLADKLSR